MPKSSFVNWINKTKFIKRDKNNETNSVNEHFTFSFLNIHLRIITRFHFASFHTHKSSPLLNIAEC